MNKYNSSGCLDLTAYEALSAIEAERRAMHTYRPIVYIASPYAGDVENHVRAARVYCRFAVAQGCIPIAPHLLFPQFMNDNDAVERELGILFGNALMSKCSEVWVFGKNISSGMCAEIKRAQRKHYKIRYFTEELEEY